MGVRWTAVDGTIQPITAVTLGLDAQGTPTYGHRHGRHGPVRGEDY